ncbi:MAG TPA: hypothetical protein VN703_00270 [Candidatus Sulfopaludibacter sp.]|nr:hypothetical protein [Candidatus Sulfopaludibacter sp.]
MSYNRVILESLNYPDYFIDHYFSNGEYFMTFDRYLEIINVNKDYESYKLAHDLYKKFIGETKQLKLNKVIFDGKKYIEYDEKEMSDDIREFHNLDLKSIFCEYNSFASPMSNDYLLDDRLIEKIGQKYNIVRYYCYSDKIFNKKISGIDILILIKEHIGYYDKEKIRLIFEIVDKYFYKDITGIIIKYIV